MNTKIPHYAMIVCSVIAAIVTALLSLQGKGEIALPVALVSALVFVNNLLGSLSGSFASAKLASKKDQAGFVSLKMLALLGVAAAAVGLILVLEACGKPTTPASVEKDLGAVVNTIVADVKAGKSAEQVEADVGALLCADFVADSGVATCVNVVAIVDEGITLAIDSGALTGLLATKGSVLQTTERIKLAARVRHTAGGAP